jgi:hypothetical protein
MKNIGFSGRKGSGKDTMGRYFLKSFPNAIQISFAGELKNEAQQFLDKIREGFDEKPDDMNSEIYERLKEIALKTKDEKVSSHSKNMTTVLQIYGTEYRRSNNPNYWVEKVERIIKQNPEKIYCITDARFLNELEMLYDNNCFLVKLQVEPEEQLSRLAFRDGEVPDLEQNNHISENEFEEFNHFNYIINSTNKTSQETFYEILKKYREDI